MKIMRYPNTVQYNSNRINIIPSRNWEDKDGIKRYTTEVVCEMFTMLGRKMDTDNNQSAGSYNESEKSDDSKSDDEDLPF